MLSNTLDFHPIPLWGNDPISLVHIFQMGGEKPPPRFLVKTSSILKPINSPEKCSSLQIFDVSLFWPYFFMIIWMWPPPRMPVTTRVMNHFQARESQTKPSFTTVTGRWPHPLGMVIQPLLGNPYNGCINPLLLGWWVYPLLYGNNGSLDPIAQMIISWGTTAPFAKRASWFRAVTWTTTSHRINGCMICLPTFNLGNFIGINVGTPYIDPMGYI